MMSDNFWENKSDAEIVNKISIIIEDWLKSEFGANSKEGGLIRLANSVRNKLTKKCYRQIRELAIIRNTFSHIDWDFLKKDRNRDRFIELAQEIIPNLKWLILIREFPTEFKNFSVEEYAYNTDTSEGSGLKIHFYLNVKNLENVNCEAVAYFSFPCGKYLLDYNGEYTTDGQVSTRVKFTPVYEQAYWEDFTMFIPYSELHSLEEGKYHDLRYSVALYNLENDCQFANSDQQSIWFYKPYSSHRESTYSSQYLTKKRTGSGLKFWKWFKTS